MIRNFDFEKINKVKLNPPSCPPGQKMPQNIKRTSFSPQEKRRKKIRKLTSATETKSDPHEPLSRILTTQRDPGQRPGSPLRIPAGLTVDLRSWLGK